MHIYTQPGSNLADNFRKFTDSDTVGPDAFSQKKKINSKLGTGPWNGALKV